MEWLKSIVDNEVIIMRDKDKASKKKEKKKRIVVFFLLPLMDKSV